MTKSGHPWNPFMVKTNPGWNLFVTLWDYFYIVRDDRVFKRKWELVK